jgi:hypothetical protein
MFTITADPQIAAQIACKQIDEQVRDAEARRTASAIRRDARTESATDSRARLRRVAARQRVRLMRAQP